MPRATCEVRAGLDVQLCASDLSVLAVSVQPRSRNGQCPCLTRQKSIQLPVMQLMAWTNEGVTF